MNEKRKMSEKERGEGKRGIDREMERIKEAHSPD